nr:gluconate 2-dehydrogenase subunit 3 family protein [Rhodothermus marinus]
MDALAQERFGRPFVRASEEQQVQLLQELEQEARQTEPRRVVIDRATGRSSTGQTHRPKTSRRDVRRGR